jgi:hypothetical protein
MEKVKEVHRHRPVIQDLHGTKTAWQEWEPILPKYWATWQCAYGVRIEVRLGGVMQDTERNQMISFGAFIESAICDRLPKLEGKMELDTKKGTFLTGLDDWGLLKIGHVGLGQKKFTRVCA